MTVLNAGLEVLSLEAGGIRMIDTLNFLPMPLSAFSKTFGIAELKKGHFPHLFNTTENWDYQGPLPALEYYCPGSLKQEAEAELVEWYEKEKIKNKVFILQKELEEYCESDVNILSKGALKFRDIFITVSFTITILYSHFY